MPPGGVDDIQSTVCISLREVGQLGRLAGGGTGPSHGCTGGGQVSAGGLPAPNEKHRSGKQIRARQQRNRSRQRMRTSARDGRKRGANAAAPSLHNTSISASTSSRRTGGAASHVHLVVHISLELLAAAGPRSCKAHGRKPVSGCEANTAPPDNDVDSIDDAPVSVSMTV